MCFWNLHLPSTQRHGQELRKILQKEKEEKNKQKSEAEKMLAIATASAVPEAIEATALSDIECQSPTFLAHPSQKQSTQNQKHGAVVVLLDDKLVGAPASARPAASGATRRISGMGDRSDVWRIQKPGIKAWF